MFRMECLNIHAAEYEIVLSIEGTEMSTFSLFRVNQGHAPRGGKSLPTFTLEKPVPGGIAEVSP